MGSVAGCQYTGKGVERVDTGLKDEQALQQEADTAKKAPKKQKGKKPAKMKNTGALKKTVQHVWNEMKKDLLGLYRGVGRRLYKIGFFIELKAKRAYYIIQLTAKFVKNRLKKWFTSLAGFVKAGLARAADDLSAPVRQVASFFHNLGVARKAEKGFFKKARLTFNYLKSGAAKYSHLLKNIGEWLLPTTAAVVFFITVGTVLRSNYALSVDFGNDQVAYVQNETVFENAQQMVKSRMIYASDEENWEFNPSLSIAVVNKDQLLETRDLVDTIIEYSGEEITPATGLYVNGIFYGATSQKKLLEEDLHALLAPYEDPSDETVRVEFVEDVEVIDGIYLTGNLISYNEMHSLFGSEIEGQVLYTIVSGDNPSAVASRNDLTLNELYAMNPEIQEGHFGVGQQLVVSQAQPFLQVKRVRTQVRYEEIPFKTTMEYSGSMEFGKVKVTTPGVEGERRIVEEITEIDGIPVSIVTVENVVTREPVTQVSMAGTYISSAGINVQPGSGILMFPVPSNNGLSRGFAGQYPAHNGLDIRASYGVPIVAAENGVVVKALYTNVGYGIYCVIDHGGGMQTLYGHCSALAVSYGQYVSKGQVIAYIGSTGNSTGNHCHFEVIINNVRYNPWNYIGG